MEWYALIFAAIVIEGLITYGKTLVVDHKFQWQVLASMLLGVLIALSFNIDLFAVAGIEAVIPFVGVVLTGVLLSRGSNYIFDLLSAISKAKTNSSTQN